LAASTAFVLVGQPHQNETAVYPEYLVRLEEGHVARWVVQSLIPNGNNSVIEPESPAEIGPSLIDFISQLVASSSQRLSVVVTALEGSSIIAHLPQVSSLSECDIHIQVTAFSIVHSVWTGKTHVSEFFPFGVNQ
jgi:hypothetical protein